MPQLATQLDRILARVCQNCPVCRTARRSPASWAARAVRRVEQRLCPFCGAYARVFGSKSHVASQAPTCHKDSDGGQSEQTKVSL